MHVVALACCDECRFDSIAQIDANHFASTPLRGQLRVTPFSAATFQNYFSLEELGSHRGDPSQKLLGVEFFGLSKVLPLPTEVFSGRAFVDSKSLTRGEPGYPVDDRKLPRARF